MSTAAARFRRLLAVLPRFAEAPSQSLAALAAERGVAVLALLEDLQALAERYDDPAGHVESVAVFIDGDDVSVRTDHFRRPMRLSVAELCALELGLALLEREAGELAAAAAPLRRRLAELITRLPQDSAYDGLRDGALTHSDHGRALPRLRDALRRRRVVTIAYERAHDEAPHARDVRPYALHFSSGAWYLIAWCEKSEGMRLFRCDRIAEAELTAREHDVPDDYSLDAVLHNGTPFVSATPPAPLVVRYGPGIARWIAERDRGPLETDGSAVRTMPLADREWAIRHVLQYGPDAEIVSPAELREEVVERLRGIVGERG
ncbi:MAG TPA: WYL domain-containing protein [Gemmatimonadales bacterium]|jgi:proteasome accessory factor C|nr:WYL domain-containing protein [Gemmatimonadales bacterium]